MSRGGFASGVALVAVAGLGGCVTPTHHPALVVADVSVCDQGWQVVQQLGTESGAPATLALAGGELYFPIWAGKQIVAIPEAGGAPRVVASQPAYKTWIEGDQLTYAILDDKLWRVPTAGGEPALIVDGQTTYLPPAYSLADDVDLDQTSFYWDLQSQIGDREWTVWRLPRDGGDARQLATLPLPTPAYAWRTLNAVPGGVLVTVESDPVAAYFLPSDGGPPQTLAPPPAPDSRTTTFLVATGPDSLVWVNESWEIGEDWPTTRMSLVDMHASGAVAVRPFWPDKPAAVRPVANVRAGWPDDAGGWIITGTEQLSDQRAHVTVWQVDAGGNARRLGCSPTGLDGFTSAIALTPDSVYAVVGVDGDSSYFDYQVVKIAR